MNREWSELNKTMQQQIMKRETYPAGLQTLFALRSQLNETILSFRGELQREDFSAMPFPNANGCHSKTIAYSLWHIFRIEDIVAHTLIKGDAQIFFRSGYRGRIGAPVITTGNELQGAEIAAFSGQLNLPALYDYIAEVRESTEQLLQSLSFDDLRRKIPDEKKEALRALHVVSEQESAAWLIDYWCEKDIRGLIRMPFSRHWIMHIEAGLRIKERIQKS
ncbi:MAG: phage head-tail adapter protein [Oscillospiraceae bacterium]|nr:phage head-tail adapter protein [Oscillospiraceae bacterium]